ASSWLDCRTLPPPAVPYRHGRARHGHPRLSTPQRSWITGSSPVMTNLSSRMWMPRIEVGHDDGLRGACAHPALADGAQARITASNLALAPGPRANGLRIGRSTPERR